MTSAHSRRPHRRGIWVGVAAFLALAMLGAGAPTAYAGAGAATSGLTYLVSTRPDRSAPVPLAGATVTGAVHIYATGAGVRSVRYWLDDPTRSGRERHWDGTAPYDLVFGGSTAVAQDTLALAEGSHVLTAVAQLTNGSTVVDTTTFRVTNPDPVGMVWSYQYPPAVSLPVTETEAQGVQVAGKVHVFGGFDPTKSCCTPWRRHYLYDPVRSEWTRLADMPGTGTTHSGVTSDSRSIYYAGGYIGDATGRYQIFGTTAVWRYDIVTDSYTALPTLPVARAAGQLALLGTWLHFFGGTPMDRKSDSGLHWSIDLRNPASGWQVRAPMPDPVNHFGAAVIGASVYVAGGQHLDTNPVMTSRLQRYDQTTNSWTLLPSMQLAVSHNASSTFALDNRLVVAGGEVQSTARSKYVQVYDLATRTWSRLSSMPLARSSGVAAPLGRHRFLYAGGGDTRVYAAIPAANAASVTAATAALVTAAAP